MRYLFFPLLLLAASPLAAQPRWTTVLGKPNNEQAFQTVAALPDGGWLAGGFRDQPDGARVAQLGRTDGADGWAWLRAYPGEGASGGITALYAAADHYLAASVQDGALRLQRLAPDGTELLTRRVELPGTPHIYRIIADGTGGYYLGGREVGNGQPAFLVLRLRADLTVVWRQAFAGNGQAFANRCRLLQRLPDGDLLAGGRLGAVAALYRLGPDGVRRWGRPFLPDNRRAVILRDWTLLNDTTLLATGELPFGGGSNRAMLWALNFDGTVRGAYPLDFVPTGHQLHAYGERLRARPDGYFDLLAQGRDSTYRATVDPTGQVIGAVHATERLPSGVQDAPVNVAFGTDGHLALAHRELNERGLPESVLMLYGSAWNDPDTLRSTNDGHLPNDYLAAIHSDAQQITVWTGSRLHPPGHAVDLTAHRLTLAGVPTDSFALAIPAYTHVEVEPVADTWHILTRELGTADSRFVLRQVDGAGTLLHEPVVLPIAVEEQYSHETRFLYPLTNDRLLLRYDTTGHVLNERGTVLFTVPLPRPSVRYSTDQNLLAPTADGGWVVGIVDNGLLLYRYAADGTLLRQQNFAPETLATGRSALIADRQGLLYFAFGNDEDGQLHLHRSRIATAALTLEDTRVTTYPFNAFSYYPVFSPSVAQLQGEHVWVGREGGTLFRSGPTTSVQTPYGAGFNDKWVPLDDLRYAVATTQHLDGHGDVVVRGYHFEVAAPHQLGTDTLADVRFFPNPTDDYLNVFPPSDYRGRLSAGLSDALGRRCGYAERQIVAAGERLLLPVAHLPAGVYYLTLQYAASRETLSVHVR